MIISSERQEGGFQENKINGYAVVTHPNGAQYSGQWKDPLIDGYGKHVVSDGSFYDGELNNCYDGHGVLISANGEKYGKKERNMAMGYTHGLMAANIRVNGKIILPKTMMGRLSSC